MSTPYPVLANKPIDQWRVTELKEELKKRKLATKGLKDDLIKRLDEALRDEMDSNGGEEAIQNEKESNSDEEAIPDEKESNRDEDAIQDEKENDKNEEAIQDEKENDKNEEAIQDEKESNRDEEAIQDENESNRDEEALQDEKSVNEEGVNGFDGNLESQAICKDETERLTKTEMVEDITVDGENQVQEENATNVDIDGSPDDLKSKSSPKEVVEDTKVDDENQIQEVDKNATKADTDDSFDKLGSGKVQDGELMVASDSEGLVGQTAERAVSVETTTTISETVIVQISSGGQDSKNKAVIEIEDPKLPQEDAVLNVSNPKNQVSEVSPVLGFQVNSESISTDSVSINEKNELKDNLNADNSILELEVVKPEMVQPSSSDVPFEGGDVHPMDEQVPHVNQSSIGEMYDTSATNADLSRKNYSAEVGSSEKLNLDRSSGDDSMEEDILESRTMDSKLNNDETGERVEVSLVKEKSPVDIMEVDLSPGKNDNHEKSVSLPVDKRKHEEQEVAVNNEPLKRQRRWNSETVKIPEPKPSNITTSTTPKDTFRSTIPKRNFARSDSTLSGSTTPKERVVPPSLRPPTNSLRINNFLRPFTLKAVQELLAKTGAVNSFWMDHIKTHCYVMYSSVEEAVETRNALYNLQWPVNGGKLLAAEFVDPQEVKQAEAPPPPPPTAAPVVSTTAPNKLPGPPPFQPSPRQQDPKPSPRVPQDPKPSPRQQDVKPSPRGQQDLRQQLPPPPPLPLPPPPPLSDPPAVRERLQLPPPPPLPKKPDPPIVTLDDLFRKTKATPRIYYLPLSEEQVAAKPSARGKNIKK